MRAAAIFLLVAACARAKAAPRPQRAPPAARSSSAQAPRPIPQPIVAPPPLRPNLAVPAVPRPAARLIGCSLKEPVCVHAAGAAPPDPALAARVLAAAERAYAGLRALQLPLPLADGALGGGPGFDLYLDAAARGACAHDDPTELFGANDRASGFATIGGQLGPDCQLESDVARVVAQAALIGLDPAAHPSTLALGGSALAAMLAPCPELEAEAVDALQRRPELCVARARPDRFAGGFLLLGYLDELRAKAPGRLWPSLVAAAAHRTPPTEASWRAEPDAWDELRHALAGAASSLEDGLVDFAIARAFLGSRSDGAHLSGAERFGAFGRVRFDWAVELSSLPRRLALTPIEPSGSAYLWLDTSGAGQADRLTVVADCEVGRAMRWALVTVDASGQEVGRHLGGRWGEAKTQLSLEQLSGVAAVVIVGSADGPDDRKHPFEPDEGEPGETGCEVTLYRQ